MCWLLYIYIHIYIHTYVCIHVYASIDLLVCVCVATVTCSTNVTQKENGVSCDSILSKISTYNLTATKQNLSAIAPLNTQ